MSRCLSNTNLVFGKTNSQIEIPVKVYLASNEEDKEQFNYISPKGNRVEQKYYDIATKKHVPREKLLSGFEYEKGKYISISKEEIDSLAKQNMIQLQEVGSLKLNHEQVAKTYYLMPDKSEKAYHLFLSSLKQLKSQAVCYWYTKRRDHLVAISPSNNVLLMHQLYFGNEVREPQEINLHKPKKEELDICKQVLKSYTLDYPQVDLIKYRDGFGERLRNLIESKEKIEPNNSLLDQLKSTNKVA